MYTPNANQELDFFSKHRASIRNQHPRNTCKHQRNASAFSDETLRIQTAKNGRQLGFKWRLDFSSLFSEAKSHKTQVLFGVRPLNSRVLFPNTGTGGTCFLLYCPVYSRTRKWGPGSRLVRGASRAARRGWAAAAVIPGNHAVPTTTRQTVKFFFAEIFLSSPQTGICFADFPNNQTKRPNRVNRTCEAPRSGLFVS